MDRLKINASWLDLSMLMFNELANPIESKH